MNQEEATVLTERCFNGEPASCSFACPFHMDLRNFLDKAANGKWSAAYKALRSAVFFPVVVSRLCPRPCEGACQRCAVGDEPVAIGKIEEACLTYVKSRKADSYALPPKSEKIAVVGAGMAGLSCALHLAQKKFGVTIYDKAEGWGGQLRSHPDFELFDADIALQFSATKAEFRFNTEIKSLDELSEYDAVYVATGRGGESFGLTDSWDPTLMTTSDPKVFLGGELCSLSLMEAIAQGAEAAKVIEVYLQIGKASLPASTYAKGYCGHTIDHSDKESAARIEPADGVAYTEEEAKAEAARCLKCDCDRCMTACEMLKMYRKKPVKLAVEVYADSKAKPPIAPCSMTRQTFSCNDCGYCKSICPEGVDIGALLSLGRTVRVAANTQPKALHHFWLGEMDFATGEASYASPAQCKYMFFPGCQLSASSPELVEKAYAYLSEKYDAGIYLGCCGAPAHWAGEAERMSENVAQIRKVWEDAGKPAFVFACASCAKLFAAFMPDIPRLTVYQLLAEDENLVPAAKFPAASIFDPCAARDFDEMQQSVRRLAEKSGAALEELKEKNRCCGYGGQMKTANPKLYNEIAENRSALSEKPYIVYCANCREVFLSKDKECAHILDMVFGEGSVKAVPSLQEKRDNVIMLKKKFMKAIEGKDFVPTAKEWDGMTLIVPDEVTAAMNEKLITLSDIKEAIWRAEKDNDKFVDENGVCLCSMVTPVITYWAEYTPNADGTYNVLSAYSHRIHFKEEV